MTFKTNLNRIKPIVQIVLQTEGGAQESFDGSDLPPPDLERLGSIHEDDMTRPLEEVPDFETDSEYPLPPPSDSLSESLSSAATKIQAGVRGYLTRKQVTKSRHLLKPFQINPSHSYLRLYMTTCTSFSLIDLREASSAD